ncbi:AMP-binding protein [Paracoccus seriniphilus]|uniref:Acyl-CoA synthetase (AMP-forming)/AMP-acid ligase II n=1 Tax=Paracoccus seriniphilus TaxID=184748 RepID=A0A239PRK6_9RHOB|nr:AMP-binding protein [Paracoccus seriniphilus]WCR13033.1 AMP-binding protein [Paracoccus seriniphilus]SNT72526.1 Acyl-CoA synthetase (AMP-forming)/AMP-acid ligase II [Paracoccus seriniphilus]
MNYDASTPPIGTVRDWLDHRAETAGRTISHLFPGSAAPLTWAELRDEARVIAARLAGLGVSRGTSVAVMLPNSRDAILCLFGVLYGGFRTTVINLAAGAEAIGYALSHSEASHVFVGAGQEELFASAAQSHDFNAIAIRVEDGIDWPAATGEAPLCELNAQDDALLMYTSGTTGRPKGVVHSHSSLLAGGWTTALAHELTSEDRALCVLPICHINGLCVTVMGPLVSGGSVAICERFSARKFWDQCGEAEVTWFSVVPTIVSHLLHSDERPDVDTRERIRFGRSASSALAPEVHRAFEERFGISLIETMGLTETAAQILSNPLSEAERKIGSPGKAYGDRVVILGPDLMPLPPDTEGEIAVRGPNVMRGYLKNEAATKEALTEDGWLRTGDLGRMDADGFVFVTGRLKELIIKGGENIAPREVDEALYAHPDVVEAAAFARPCSSYGERVEAAVALRAGAAASEAELIELCHEKLGKFKSPDSIHFLAELPKGPSGKIQRRHLLEITRAGG